MAIIFRPPIIHVIYARAKAQSEYIVNLLPLQNPVVVTAPFSQDLWESTASPKTKAYAEPVDTPDTLLRPNPAQPFVQSSWYQIPRVPRSLKSDVYSWGYSLYQPNPSRPFVQSDWSTIATKSRAAKVDIVEILLPVLQPNPSRPFFNLDSSRIFTRQVVRSDIFVNLLPLQNPPVVATPFTQFDWSNPHLVRASSSIRDFVSSGNSIGPVPPSSTAKEWLARARRRNRR